MSTDLPMPPDDPQAPTCGKTRTHGEHNYDKAYTGSGTDGDPWRLASWLWCPGVKEAQA